MGSDGGGGSYECGTPLSEGIGIISDQDHTSRGIILGLRFRVAGFVNRGLVMQSCENYVKVESTDHTALDMCFRFDVTG